MNQHPLLKKLEDYLLTSELTSAQHATLTEALRDRANILIAGSTAAGKTVLLNAILNSSPSAPLHVYDPPELTHAFDHAVWARPRQGGLATVHAISPSEAMTALKALCPPTQTPAVDLLVFISRSNASLLGSHRALTFHDPATIFPSSKTHPK